MKKLFTILFLFCFVSTYGQKQPIPCPSCLTSLTTAPWNVRASDSTYWVYNGATWLWQNVLNKYQADKLYAPIGGGGSFMTTSTTQTGLTGNKTSSGIYTLGGLNTPSVGFTNGAFTTTLSGPASNQTIALPALSGTVPIFASTPVSGGLVGWSGPSGAIMNITALPNGTTATTQTAGDNSTKVATTAYVDAAVPSISFGAFGSSPNANGGSYSGGVITLQPASASFPGGVTTGTQTFAGDKTLTGHTTITNTAAGFSGLDVSSTGASGSNSISASNSGTGALFSGNATSTGDLLSLSKSGVVKFWVKNNADIYSASLTNGLVKSTSGVLSNATAGTDYLTPSGSGASLTGVVHTTGTETVGGLKTFSSRVTISSADPGIVLNGVSGNFSIGSDVGGHYLSGAASLPMLLQTNSLTRYEISSGGNHNFKSGTATFGGALSGTSAAFNNNVTITAVSPYTQLVKATTSGTAFHNFVTTSTGQTWNLGVINSVDNFTLVNSTLGSTAITVAASNNNVTLSGALSGTSATFSGILDVNNSTGSSNYGVTLTNSNSGGNGTRIRGGTGSSLYALAVQDYNGGNTWMAVRGDGVSLFTSNVGIGTTSPGSKLDVAGNISLSTVGSGLLIKEGSNATMGTATLSGGSVTVNTTAVTANSRIFVSHGSDNATVSGAVRVQSRSAGTSFTIQSTSGSDAGNVDWLIVEPAP